MYCPSGAGGLKEVVLKVPLAVLTGSTATLVCHYDLEGDPLYTVKWYKGREEFFRYVPKEHPHTRVFALPGVFVDVSESGPDRVTLRDVQKQLAGRYRCEVSTDAPDFHTQVVSAQVQVVELPEGSPSVAVEKNSYALGDILRANCTAPWAALPLNLTWLINGHKVNESILHTVDVNVTTVGLQTEVNKFQGGKLRLQCLAQLYDVYMTVQEVWLDEDRPRLASVLGTRESSADNNGGCGGYVMATWTLGSSLVLLLLSS
ncbi:uncharacterized protein LOC124363338 [Homalodisca vitripennis]|uniref:uncharacterized protein LOC124363338 n=1 Tax=Homalodisca vitripennis TaxID=197043 RepID=UPI001EEA1630|nr:uncharacterized protein LOC124363338 [Homalodisca vitripennis]